MEIKVTLVTAETDEEKLTLALDGKIDSTNVQEVKEIILRLIGEIGDRELILDAERLRYLSSAGLRLLIDINKSINGRIMLVNVHPVVEEVLDLTGFSQIFEVQRAMRTVRTDGCRKIGQGAAAEVYDFGNDSIIKVFFPNTSLETVRREIQVARNALIAGIPSVIPYDTVRVGEDRYGNVYEMVGMKTLSQAVMDEPGRLEEFIDRFVQLYRQIHETPGESFGFPRTKDVFNRYLDDCGDWYTDDEIKALRKLTASFPDRDTLNHGDFHPKNIMIREDDLIVIDVGEMSTGHPAFDYLTTGMFTCFLENDRDFVEFMVGMKTEQIEKLWQVLLSATFAGKSEQELNEIYRLFCRLSLLKVGCSPAFAKDAPAAFTQSCVDTVKQKLIPYIDELAEQISQFDW